MDFFQSILMEEQNKIIDKNYNKTNPSWNILLNDFELMHLYNYLALDDDEKIGKVDIFLEIADNNIDRDKIYKFLYDLLDDEKKEEIEIAKKRLVMAQRADEYERKQKEHQAWVEENIRQLKVLIIIILIIFFVIILPIWIGIKLGYL